jgi:hypothetical protein
MECVRTHQGGSDSPRAPPRHRGTGGTEIKLRVCYDVQMADEKLPVAPPSSAKLRAADLALLDEDARRFVVRDRPAADALWVALLKPRDVVLREARLIHARWGELDPGAPLGRLEAALGGPAAIQCIATATVAKAMMGDAVSTAQVFDRIEGRATPRKLDETEAAESRATMIAGIEAVVRSMNAPRPGDRPGDGALDVTPTPVEDPPRLKPRSNGHDDGPDEPGGAAKP